MFNPPSQLCSLYAQSEWALADAEHSATLIQLSRLADHACDLRATLAWNRQGGRPRRTRSVVLVRPDDPRMRAWVALSRSDSLVRPLMEPEYADILPRGLRYEVYKTVTATDVHLWAGLTGRPSLVRGASAFAQQAAVERCVAPDAYLTGLVVDTATCLATSLPSPGAMLTGLLVQFTAPVAVGATLVVVVTVTEWDAVAGLYRLDIRATRADGMLAVTGIAGLRPPTASLAAA